MEIRLLGPAVRVMIDGRSADAGTLKERSILALLALTPGKAVPTATLIDRVWGPSPSAAVRSSLYSCVARIRSRLVAAGAGVGLRKLSHGYTLEIAPDAVDWHRVQNMRLRARDLAESGEHSSAAVLLWEALSLWEGEPLAEIPGEWTHGHRASMNQTRLVLVDGWARSCLRIGQHEDVIARVSEEAARHRTNEQLCARLMEALAGVGRHAEAVETYHGLRAVLAEEGGVPGGPTQDVFQRVLAAQARAADRAPEPGAPEAPAAQVSPAPPVPASSAPPRVHDSLARDIGDFTARGPELTEVLTRARARSHGTTVVVVNGLAGVGKTALAVRAAHLLRAEFDVRVQLDLHGHSAARAPLEPEEALHTLLRELHVDADHIPAEPQARAALWSSRLAGRRVLLVLDDAVPGRIAPLLPGTPGCVALVTSRWKLTELDGVHHLRLPEPSPAEATAMLAAFAGLGPDRRGEPDLERIAAACGNLPIAIRVAGGRLRHRPTWPPGHLADRLERDGLSEMRSFGRDVAAVFEMSVQALGESARAAFLRFGVHPVAESTLPVLAAALGEGPGGRAAAESAVEELLEANLLDEIAPGRYRMHGLLHAFARRRAAELMPAEERRGALVRMLEHYRAAADAADAVAHPWRRRPQERSDTLVAPQPFTDAAQARRWFAEEYPVLDAVTADACDGEFAPWPEVRRYAVALPLVMAGLTRSDGPWERSEHHLAVCLELCGQDGDEPNRALAALELSRVQRRLRRLDDARANAETALEHWRSGGDAAGEALAHDELGSIHFDAARNTAALREHEAALELFTAIGDCRGRAVALNHVGTCLAQLGDLDGAETACAEAVASLRELGDRGTEARALANLSGVLHLRGYHRDAQRIGEQALAVFDEIGDRLNSGSLAHNLAEVLAYRGLFEEAAERYRRARELLSAAGADVEAIRALVGLGSAQLALGRRHRAWTALEEAITLVGPLSDPVTESQVMLARGDVLRAFDRSAEARMHYRSARGLAGSGASAIDEALAHDRLGDLCAGEGRRAEAVEHWRRAALATPANSHHATAVRVKMEALGQTVVSGPISGLV
ncbi:BTAD domain-containing putative transcriptional regulator [Streptomonospora sp. PA3]|uniref:BTAD domain-containing putative transcriptional regulator n=1 Tax=Streptomonospora sp. PA3 TaxID=2607326 RepID=UPI0016424496